MIVIYKEIECKGMFFENNRSLYKYVENSSIINEVTELRKVYGNEIDRIEGIAGNGTCLVYDKEKFYIVKV